MELIVESSEETSVESSVDSSMESSGVTSVKLNMDSGIEFTH